MIRFSAALVAVAIGMLIGGIAASELSLVYIAIVVSAVALVALATGVVLKRAELFGQGPGLVPAGAGASPVPPVRAGESHDQHRAGTPVPPPLQGVVLGPGAAFGRNTQAAPSQSAAPWEAQTAARAPWPSPAPAPARQAAAPSGGTPGGRAGGWGGPDAAEPPVAADAAAQGGATAPWAWAAPSPSAAPPTAPAPTVSDVPPATTGAGSGSVPPSWFDRRNRAASADAPATTPAPASASGWPWSSTDIASTGTTGTGSTDTGTGSTDTMASEDTDKANDAKADDTVALNAPADAATAATAADEDDDWPTRYSWLDDEPNENGGEGEADLDDHAPPSAASPDPLADEPAAPGNAGTPDTETPDAGIPDTGPPEATVTELGDADAAPDADVAAPAAPVDPIRLDPDPDPEAEATGEAAGEPPAATVADAAPETGLVAVLRGVPRYHNPDCVLIRFMPEGDTQKVSIAQAKESGCTPCAACQPEG